MEKPTLVGPPLEASTNELCPGCLGKLRAKSNFSCSNCQIRMCEEKCQNDSELHQLECGFLVNKCHKIEFLTALRFLGLKKRHPGKYQSLLKLVSNKNVKVISLTGFEFDDFSKGQTYNIGLLFCFSIVEKWARLGWNYANGTRYPNQF